MPCMAPLLWHNSCPFVDYYVTVNNFPTSETPAWQNTHLLRGALARDTSARAALARAMCQFTLVLWIKISPMCDHQEAQFSIRPRASTERLRRWSAFFLLRKACLLFPVQAASAHSSRSENPVTGHSPSQVCRVQSHIPVTLTGGLLRVQGVAIWACECICYPSTLLVGRFCDQFPTGWLLQYVVHVFASTFTILKTYCITMEQLFQYCSVKVSIELDWSLVLMVVVLPGSNGHNY
jgi:hypothetical protein